jgi:hypothetical protein
MNAAHLVIYPVALSHSRAKQSECQAHDLPFAIWLGLMCKTTDSVSMVGWLELFRIIRPRNPEVRKALRVTKMNCSMTW